MEYQENDLIADFINGGEKAFKEIHKKYFSRMVVFACDFVTDEKQAEDIVQDTFIKLFKIHERFNSIPSIKAFLYIAVRNTSFNYIRHINRLSESQKNYANTQAEAQLMNDQLDGDLLHALFQSVNKLPPQSRRVIDLLYVDDLSYCQVAETLNISTKTVENIRAYALKLLRTDFRQKGLISVVFAFFYCVSSLS